MNVDLIMFYITHICINSLQNAISKKRIKDNFNNYVKIDEYTTPCKKKDKNYNVLFIYLSINSNKSCYIIWHIIKYFNIGNNLVYNMSKELK